MSFCTVIKNEEKINPSKSILAKSTVLLTLEPRKLLTPTTVLD